MICDETVGTRPCGRRCGALKFVDGGLAEGGGGNGPR